MIEQNGISEFADKLSRLLIASLDNHFENNFDFDRFGEPEREIVRREKNLAFVFENIEKFSEVYELLENGDSKQLYVLLTAFRILGHRKVRLPLSTDAYWEVREKLNRYVDAGAECIEAKGFDGKLRLTDLNFLGVPVRQYTVGGGVLIDYILKQYEYNASDLRIGVNPGDVVVDAGACWGDTALYFAHLTGPAGRVISFDFTENVDIFRKNIALNPDLAPRIILIEKAVWRNSQGHLFFNENGPSTSVSRDGKEKSRGVRSISIDDLVAEQNLDRIDYIKMDIEGAEQEALAGAAQTLARYRPQLAITIYHNELEDFVEVPRMLHAMNLGYKFYIGHYTTYHEETVLFAKV